MTARMMARILVYAYMSGLTTLGCVNGLVAGDAGVAWFCGIVALLSGLLALYEIGREDSR